MSRIDESINKMQEYINEIRKKSIEQAQKLSIEGKNQVETIANKTINTINSSIEKLEEMKKQVNDENELNDFLDRLEKKCKDVADYTELKIDEIKPVVQDNISNLKKDLDKSFDDIKDEIKKSTIDVKKDLETAYDRLLDNENVKNVIKFAKDMKVKAIDYYNKPETQKAINNAKLKIIEVAEKGLDTLKVILEKDDINNKDENK